MNKRSTDLSSKERNRLVSLAKHVQEATPLLLKEAGIPLTGDAVIALAPAGKKSGDASLKIGIEPSTSQHVAAQLSGKPCIFIACSHTKPGGGWLSGAIAQEESVSRESSWAVQCAANPSWHATSSGWLGPKGALVLDGLAYFSEKPTPVVFAGIAAANKSACGSEKEWNSQLAARSLELSNAVEAGLREAKRRGCTAAVLCAAGTGVFGWSPAEALTAIWEGASASRFKGQIVLAAGNEQAAQRLLGATPYFFLISNAAVPGKAFGRA